LAATYLSLALVGVVGGEGLDAAVVHLVTAAVTFGFAAAVLPVVVPQRSEGEGDGRGGGGNQDGGDPPPPWWGDFERQFWWHVRGPRPEPERPRERAPA
jgi:hypothetical protein